jgi:Tol biopolymer transport system component
MTESVPEPTVFAPGVVSGPLRDYDITFTPDGLEAYFTRRSRRGGPAILVTTYVDGRWSDPAPVPFASERDEAPFVSDDGTRLFFSSRRPMEGHTEPSDNLWVAPRVGELWGEPVPVPGPVNQPRAEAGRYTLGTELGPALFPDGSLLYWTRLDPEWGGDLYVALPDEEGGFNEPRPLRINSYGDEMNPVVAPGGRYIVFQAYRDADAHGEQDLYYVERTEYGWTDPVLLPEPLNSSASDGWPAFSPDGRHFFFASDRGRDPGFYDIWWVNAEALGLPGLRASRTR